MIIGFQRPDYCSNSFHMILFKLADNMFGLDISDMCEIYLNILMN